jgi:hypothetical protein
VDLLQDAVQAALRAALRINRDSFVAAVQVVEVLAQGRCRRSEAYSPCVLLLVGLQAVRSKHRSPARCDQLLKEAQGDDEA